MINIIIKRKNLSKVIDVSDYTFKDFVKTCLVYSSAGYDVRVKRY